MRLHHFLAVALLLAGCSHPSRYAEPEKNLEIEEDARAFHWAIHDPHGVHLNYPGFLVGVEKSPRHIAMEKNSKNKIACQPSNNGMTEIKKWKKNLTSDSQINELFIKSYDRLLTDPKVQFPTHIIRSDFCPTASGGEAQSCSDGFGKLQGIVATPIYSIFDSSPKSGCSPFEHGWDSLDTLGVELTKAMNQGKYTHIFLYTMGWNTDQLEAVRNINSLYGNMLEQASRDPVAQKNFRPLVIGVTWPSMLQIIDAQLLGSYLIKANDADELGALWIHRILYDVVAKVKKRPNGQLVPVIVVGHSFGARAVASGVFAPALSQPTAHGPVVDAVLLLQGAFDIRRFQSNDPGHEGAAYHNFAQQVKRVVVTSSEHDKATPLAFWAEHAGSRKAYNLACKDTSTFTCTILPEDSSLPTVPSNDRRILFLDASKTIKYQMMGTSSGAHSDIYRDTIGRLTWDLARSVSTEAPKPHSP